MADDDATGDNPEEPEEATKATDGKPDLKLAGGSALERAANEEDPDYDPEKDPQLNFFTNGKFDLGKVVRAKIPVEYKMKIEGKSIPNIKGGLIDPYGPPVSLFSECVVDSYKPQFIRDENHKVESLVMYVTLKPYVAQAVDTEAGQVLLSESLKGKKIYPALRDMILEADAAEAS